MAKKLSQHLADLAKIVAAGEDPDMDFPFKMQVDTSSSVDDPHFLAGTITFPEDDGASQISFDSRNVASDQS